MYKLQNNSVLRLSDNASIPLVNGNMDYEEYKQWLAEGNIPEPIDAPTAEQIKAEIEQAIQNMLDTKAKELRWDDMKSARAAAGIPLDPTATDMENAIVEQAIKLARWYIKVWAKAGELEATGNVYTVDEVIGLMPEYVG